MVDQDSYRVIVAVCLLESAFYGTAMSLGPVMIYEAVGLTKYPNAVALLNVMYGVGDVLVNWLGGEYTTHPFNECLTYLIIIIGPIHKETLETLKPL